MSMPKPLELVVLLVIYAISTYPVSFLINKWTKQWREEIEDSQQERDSLGNAGKWIGRLERILIISFLWYDQFTAVGFLITAKSLLRLNDKEVKFPRKQTEYVLIGTLISFTCAFFLGILGKFLLGLI